MGGEGGLLSLHKPSILVHFCSIFLLFLPKYFINVIILENPFLFHSLAYQFETVASHLTLIVVEYVHLITNQLIQILLFMLF